MAKLHQWHFDEADDLFYSLYMVGDKMIYLRSVYHPRVWDVEYYPSISTKMMNVHYDECLLRHGANHKEEPDIDYVQSSTGLRDKVQAICNRYHLFPQPSIDATVQGEWSMSRFANEWRRATPEEASNMYHYWADHDWVNKFAKKRLYLKGGLE